jgi:hypothetical protein
MMKTANYPHDRIAVDPATGCWNWTGSINNSGYARMNHGYAHRILYELHRGPIPEGKTLDHLCRNRRCVNPGHLEVVSGHENTLRGMGVAGQNAKRTHCRKGHEFTPENTIWRERADRHPWRECRTCRAQWSAITIARRKARGAA